MFHLNLSPPVVAVVVLLDFATVSAARLGAKAMILSNLVTLVDKCGHFVHLAFSHCGCFMAILLFPMI